MLGCCFVNEVILVFVVLTSVILRLLHKQHLEQKKKLATFKEYSCFYVMRKHIGV